MPAPSTFAKKLAALAQQRHAKFQFTNEADPSLSLSKSSGGPKNRFSFSSCTRVPWSAVFISWCVMHAGATKAEFKFAMAHSVFAHQAIGNTFKGKGVFQGFDITTQKPAIGDIVQNNRRGNKFDFAFARTHAHYQSHSVLLSKSDGMPRVVFPFCVGGNENDSVRRSVIRLNSNGFIKQRSGNPFICVINLK